MTNFKKVNIETWFRKNSYLFFKDFDDPYFNFTTNLKINSLLSDSKSSNKSFFLSTVHLCLKIANSIENFRMRFFENELVLFDHIDGDSTVLYEDESFGFAYYDYVEDLEEFTQNSLQEIEKRKKDKSFVPNENGPKSNLIYFSSIPWFSFTSTKHAQHHTINKSIPRISFGKYFTQDEKVLLPMSIEANHAIMDGYHFGLFFEKFEAIAG